MKRLLYLLLVCFGVFASQAEEWEYKELPTYPYYKFHYDSNIGEALLQGVDSLAYIPKEEIYIDALQEAYLKEGADSSQLKSIYVVSPLPEVLFSSLHGVGNLFSHDWGKTWEKPSSEVGHIYYTGNYVILDNTYYIVHNGIGDIVYTEDSCRTWKKLAVNVSGSASVKYYNFQSVNDSTFFFFESIDKVGDSAVYYNINTKTRQSKAVSNSSIHVRSLEAAVNGDTITIFNNHMPGEVYRSTNRGYKWSYLYNFKDIFNQFDDYTGKYHVYFRKRGNVIYTEMECLNSGHGYYSQILYSADLGKSWLLDLTFVAEERYGYLYLKNGVYQKFDPFTYELSDIYLKMRNYGSFRRLKEEELYFIEESDSIFVKSKENSSWRLDTNTYKQKYITKYGREYILDRDGSLYSKYDKDLTHLSNTNSFQVITETDIIDVIKLYSDEDDLVKVIFVSNNKVISETILPNDGKILLGVDFENTEEYFKLEIEANDKVKLIKNNIQNSKLDTNFLNLYIGGDDLLHSLVSGDNIYLLGNSHIYVSKNDGLYFDQVNRTTQFIDNDHLHNNFQVNDGDLYLAGSEGLLKLTDELEWVNLLEDVTNAYSFGVEFVNNKIYAYTLEGLFMRDAPNKVSSEISHRTTVYEYRSGIYRAEASEEDMFARTLAKENSGKLHLISYHPDNYENIPKTTEDPDFRTEVASTIVENIGIELAKSLVINRDKDFNLVTNEGFTPKLYHDEIREVVEESVDVLSPVNLKVIADVNPTSRELTAEVSYYFTDDSEGEHRLSVHLLQDNIKGSQLRGFLNPNQISADGQYKHQNVFRMSLTENISGDQILNAVKDVYSDKKYKVMLPDSIKNVKLELADLRIIAFIENEDEILQATQAEVELFEENTVDLTLEDRTEIKNQYFFDYIKPTVEITNNGSTKVTQFDLTLKYGDFVSTQRFDIKIAKNSSVLVELDSLKIDAIGNYHFSVTGFENLNNSDVTGFYLADNTPDDNDCKVEGIRLRREAFEYTKFTFENSSANDYGLDRSKNRDINIFRKTGIGAENTNNSLGFRLNEYLDVADKPAYIVFGEMDLTNKESAFLSFHYAYDDGKQTGTPPTYTVEYSENDGKAWRTLYTMRPESTFSTSESTFYPSSKDYKKNYYSLEKCLGKKTLIRIGVTPGIGGKSCWIDQVAINDIIPRLIANPEKVDFGKVTLQDGVSVLRKIEIRNDGQENLSLDSVRFSGADAGHYYLDAPFADTTLKSGEAIYLYIRFYPDVIQQYIALLEIYSNDPLYGKKNIRLEGVGQGTSVNENGFSGDELIVYPNPSSDYIRFKFGGVIDVIEIIDLQGKNYFVNSEKKELDVSELPVGTYFLKIKSEGKAYLKQFVVTR